MPRKAKSKSLSATILMASGLFTASLSGCHSQVNASLSDDTLDTKTFVPEYEPNQALIITTDAVGRMEYVEPGTGLAFIEELLEAGAPKVVVIDGEHSSPREMLLVGRKALEGSSLDADNRVSVLTFGVNEDMGFGTWARDFFPISWRSSSDIGLSGFRYRFSQRVDQAIGLELGKTTLKSEKLFESGNFYSTSDGKCFFGAAGANMRGWAEYNGVEEDLRKMGCKETLMLPAPFSFSKNEESIPFTPIAHLDLWTKVISDNQALIAKIDSTFFDALLKGANEKQKAHLIEVKLQIENVLADGEKVFTEAGMEVIRVPLPLSKNAILDPLLNAVLIGNNMILSGSKPPENLEEEYSQAIERSVSAIESLGINVKIVDASALLTGNGGLHCATMQAPLAIFDSLQGNQPSRGITPTSANEVIDFEGGVTPSSPD